MYGVFRLFLMGLVCVSVFAIYVSGNVWLDFWGEIESQKILASVGSVQEPNNQLPKIYYNGLPKPELSATAHAAYFVRQNEWLTIESFSEKELKPVASITKLMTALVVLENFSPETFFNISDVYLSNPKNKNDSVLANDFSRDDLLKILLVSSDNQIAEYLAKNFQTGKSFVDEMNETALRRGLNAFFVNPTGLTDKHAKDNQMDAQSVAKLAYFVFKNYREVFSFSSLSSFSLEIGNENKTFSATNELLIEEDFPFEILGGKTGQTTKAKKNLVMITKSYPKDFSGDMSGRGFFVFVVLGSDNHFLDMQKLAEWTKESFVIE